MQSRRDQSAQFSRTYLAMKSLAGLVAVLTLFQVTVQARARCGSPELPLMSSIKSLRDFYEEGDVLNVRCMGGSLVFPDLDRHMTSSPITCMAGRWTGTIGRCSQVMIYDSGTYAGIATPRNRVSVDTDISKEDFKILTDSDPQSCVMVGEESKKWTMNFSAPLFLSQIALIVTNADLISKTRALFAVSTPRGNCRVHDNLNMSSLPLLFLVYHCPSAEKTSELTIAFDQREPPIGLCDIDLFVVSTDECGTPERPLFASTNILSIQNNSKVVEYNCAEGYKLDRNSFRVCGQDGLWHPRAAPRCVPRATCDLNANLIVHRNFSHHYTDLDLEGRAIPGLTWRSYQCSNASEALDMNSPSITRAAGLAPNNVQTCSLNGTWWPSIESLPRCVAREETFLMYNHYYQRSRTLIILLLGGLFLFFLGIALLAIQTRKSIARLQHQLREFNYRNTSKVLPSHIISYITGSLADDDDAAKKNEKAQIKLPEA